MARGGSTQEFVPIEKIRDGVITLKSGELRAVLITNSLNLGLKSEDELTAIISQFQNFLNSLDFPVQFFVESRKLRIENYLETLKERSKNVKEDLLKIQIHEYMGFIQKFTEESNIMTKHFFIVIPYFTAYSQNKSPFTSSFTLQKQKEEDPFEVSRVQLEQRILVVTQGLARFGIRAKKLGTEELVELFYKVFNPNEHGGHSQVMAQSQ